MEILVTLGGMSILMFMAWRVGRTQCTDDIESAREEIVEWRRKCANFDTMNQSLCREMAGMNKTLRWYESVNGVGWVYKDKEVVSIGQVKHGDREYLILEPARKGFTPYIVRKDQATLRFISPKVE